MRGGGWAEVVDWVSTERGRKLKCASFSSSRDSLQAFVF